MERTAIILFLNALVKLEYTNGFALTGVIKQVFEETILFETSQTSSLINLNDIRNVVLKERNNDRRQ